MALFPILLAAQDKSLVILHLNDTHSRIEPFPEGGGSNAGRGGVVRHDAYINEVRRENKNNTLLFHCGDFVQGTPYFNLFKGETEMSIANLMKVDAACLGNHEFDNGLVQLASMLKIAKFPFVATNLDFTGTPLEGLTKKYVIIKRNGLKIGVIGLTISPEGLVAKKNCEGVKYLDPVESANNMADFLKIKEKCDIIVCISHLGYYADDKRDGDVKVAKNSRFIDIVLGGHTHTFMPEPKRVQNLDGKEVVINQTGAYGVYIGRLDVALEKIAE
ncbi:MAG: metallophosphoesterase [Dysgonamonadaceae bacterium]|nr:metallophosphoesterase [Dysgonamonadaceae bacterium]